ncbi:MAG TPA: phosphatase PAP2 family protein [Sphingomicrobium sp.]
MAAVTAVELIWWLAAWWRGVAPAPHVAIYLGLALTGLAVAIGLRLVLRLPPTGGRWPAVLAGTVLVGVGASAFLPLKYAIPREVPFWLDQPIALAERRLFGADPWLLLDRLLGWATVPMDWLYGCWLPVQLLVLFSLILARPSSIKSRALIAYSLAWFLLGAVAAMLLSSAGPLFYDRLYGGHQFQPLHAMLRTRGGWVALAESDLMWAARSDNDPGLVAGISAVPSIHVAMSLWIYLAAREIMPRAALPAFAYFLLVWIGSVQLGWHYASDGLAGAIGMLGVWQLAKTVQVLFRKRRGNRLPFAAGE